MNDNIIQKSLKKNAILNIIRKIMQIIFPIITIPYASRILLPIGIGKVNFASNIVSYFLMIASLGIGSYGVREVAKNRDNKDLLTKLTKELFYLNLISTIIAYFLLFLAIVLLPKLFVYRKLICVFSSMILCTTIGMEWLYTGKEEFTYITLRQIVFQCISVILLFCFVKKETDFVNYAIITVFASVGSNVFNFFYSRKFINWKKKYKLNLLTHLKSVFVFFGSTIAINIYVILDTTMIGFICGEQEVGYYSMANKITKIIITLIFSISAVLVPRCSYYIEKKLEKEFQLLLIKSLNINFFLSIPAFTGIYLLSPLIIKLFCGESFLPSSSIMKLLSFIIITVPLSSLISNQILIPKEKELQIFYITCGGAVLNFILNFILIPKYKAIGSAVSSISTEFLITFFYIIITIKFVKYKDILKSLMQYIIATFCMAFFIMVISHIIINDLVLLCISIIGGVCVYLFVLVCLKNVIVKYILKILKKYFSN